MIAENRSINYIYCYQSIDNFKWSLLLTFLNVFGIVNILIMDYLLFALQIKCIEYVTLFKVFN